MKKVFASVIIGLALGAMSVVSAADMSVGGGGFFTSDLGGGFFGFAGKYDDGTKASETVPWTGGGVHAFLDMDYVEFGVDLTFGSGTPQSTYDGKTDKSSTTISFTGLGISVLGKYPIALAENMSLYPAAGIDYALVLAGESKSGSYKQKLGEGGAPKPGEFSALWIKFGGGLDFALSETMFVRPELLYGIRLANKYENDYVKRVKDQANAYGESVDIHPALGHGLTVKAGVGLRL